MMTQFSSQKITLLLALLMAASSQAGDLQLEKAIPLSGVESRIDHFSVDVPGQRLFVAALGNGSVEIVDLKRAERIGEIRGLPEPQGTYYDSTTGRLYVATGGDGRLRVYDGKSLTLQQTFEFGADADNIRYDQETGNIWVGYGDGGIGIVSSMGKKVGLISLGTHPESFQFAENGDRVFVNVPKQFGIIVVDRQQRAAVAKWGLGGASANYPMALDTTNKRLFVGCRLPPRLVVLDTNSGQIVSTLPTVGDCDDIFYDASRQALYVIGGEGTVEVLQQRDPNNYEPGARITTAPGARTGFFAPAFHRLYVAVPHRGSQIAEVLVYRVDRD